MKKLIAMLLVLVLVTAALTVVVLAGQEPEPEEVSAEPMGAMTGGWSATESPEITEEVHTLVDKATEGLLGVNYTPVAYLGTQLVAGTNHCVLCQAAAVYPGAAPYYVLLYIYENLSGGTEILDIEALDLGSLISYGEE